VAEENATARFGIVVEADASAVEPAARALEDLNTQIQGDQKALQSMRRAMTALKGDSSVSAAAVGELKTQIDVQKIVIAQAQAKYIELGGTFRHAAQAATDAGAAQAAAAATGRTAAAEATAAAAAAAKAQKEAFEGASKAAYASALQAGQSNAQAALSAQLAAQQIGASQDSAAAAATRAATQHAAAMKVETEAARELEQVQRNTAGAHLFAQQAAQVQALSENQLSTLIAKETVEVQALQSALGRLEAAHAGATPAADQLRSKIEASRAAAAAAQARYTALGGSTVKLQASLKAAAVEAEVSGRGLLGLLDAAKGLPGPLGAVGRSAEPLRRYFESGRLAALGFAAGIAVVAVAAVAGATALFGFGVAAAAARRQEVLFLEALSRSGKDARVAENAGQGLQTMFDSIASNSATAREDVSKYGQALFRAGLRGNDLWTATEAASTASAAMGDTGAQAFIKQAEAAKAAGQSIGKLANDVDTKFGGVAAARLLDLDVQTRKLKEGFTQIFSGLKIEGFLRGLRQVTSLFTANTASGRALKVLFESMFGPLADGAEGAGKIVRRFFQGVILGALQLGIWFQKVRIWWKNAFGDVQILKNLDLATVALNAGQIAVGVFAVGLGALAVAAGMAALALAGVIGPFVAIGYAAVKAYTLVSEIKWGELGSSIVNGIVEGLDPTKLLAKVKGLATGAWTTFKETLGIASPSKLFKWGGKMTTEGAAQGFDEGAPTVHQAAARMAPKPQSVFSIGAGMRSPVNEDARAAGRASANVNLMRGLTGGSFLETSKGAPGAAPVPRFETPKVPPATISVPRATMTEDRAPATQGKDKGQGGATVFQFGDIIVGAGATPEQAKAAGSAFMNELQNALEGVSVHLGAKVA
jgi:hypothetical protein